MPPAASRQDALHAVASALARVEDDQLRHEAEQALQLLTNESNAPFSKAVLSAAFHDLKAPLAAVMMNASALTKSPPFADEQQRERRRLDAIVRCARKAHALLGDVHDLLRLERGQLALNPTFTSFAAFAQSLESRVGGVLTERQARLCFQMDEPAQPLRFDSTQLITALEHLISNAVKAAPLGSEAKLHLQAEGVQVQGAIELPGLSDAEPDRFELLGSTVAARLLAAQGGEIRREPGRIIFNWTAALA